MSQLVVLVINDVSQLEPVLTAWNNAGALGITVLPSTGLGHLTDYRRDDFPLFPSLNTMLESHEFHHRTIFTVASNDELVDALIAAAQHVIGDLDTANTGILFTLPVGRVLGLGQ